MAEHHTTPTATIVGVGAALTGGSARFLAQINPVNPWENYDQRLAAALITAALSAIVGYSATQLCKWLFLKLKKPKK